MTLGFLVVALGAAVLAAHLLRRPVTQGSRAVAVALPPRVVLPPAPMAAPPPSLPLAQPRPQAGPPPSLEAPQPERHGSEAQPAWLRFAAAAPRLRDKPLVAIVIDDLGLDHARTERAIALPPAVTLSFLAYAPGLPALTAAARGKGHELIVHVPMEPLNAHVDMGPNGLATTLSRGEVLRRLDWDLDRFEGYVGINNHMGSRFTSDGEAMRWVMEALKARGLMFLDSRTIANSVGAKAAAAGGVPYAERDVFLDDDQRAPAVEEQLRAVEAVARRRGSAIAIGHPHDATTAALSAWIATLSEKGLVLVPLTEIVKARLKIG
jgi:uncharacterized protein